MAVSMDVATENSRTDTTSPQTFSHVAASSGVKGVLLFIMHGTSDTDHVSAASYGGTAMSRVVRASTVGAGEPGASEVWFLGSGISQGTQTASYTPGGTTDDIYAVCVTILAAADTQVVDSDTLSGTAVTDPSITLQYGGASCMAFAGLWDAESGAAEVFTVNANCTLVHDISSLGGGTQFANVIKQTTAGTADFAIGGTCLSDEVAYVAVAIGEGAAALDPIRLIWRQ